MKRITFAVLSLLLFASVLSAHEVPDIVRIPVFLKPQDGRMTMLVRMPANALIDFLFPAFADGGLDLTVADGIAAEGAQVWIADLLTVDEDGTRIPAPHVLKVRISRLNDPFFGTFDDALRSVNGPPLGKDAFVSLDQAVVDALVEAPIASPTSRFSFEPRFGRLGVLVYTTLTFLAPSGEVRQFVYEGDPEAFDLNPDRGRVLARFVRAGLWHYISGREYLLFALGAALVFRRFRPAWRFALALVVAETATLVAAATLFPPAPWLTVVAAILVAAATTYVAIEAIMAIDGSRVGLAIVSGVILAGGFWSSLQPVVQFGGAHAITATLGFAGGIVLSELVALALAILLVMIAIRVSRAPRAVIVIAAALAIHVSWRQMLDRADALVLTPPPLPGPGPLAITVAGGVVLTALAAWVSRTRRPRAASAS